MLTHLVTRHPILGESLETLGYEVRFSDREVELQDEEKLEEVLPNFVGEKPFFLSQINLQNEPLIQKIEDKSKVIVIFGKADIERSNDYKTDIQGINAQEMLGVALRYDKGLNGVDYGDFNYVLVDTLDLNEDELKEICEQVHAKGAKIIGCQVATHASLQLLQKIGFDFTQGTYLTTPNLRATSDQQSQTNVLLFSLLKELQDPDASLARVEKALVQDPRLVYKLLRVVNSAAFGLKRKIESIREAIVFIGLRQIKRWAVLLSLSNIEGKPSELMRTSMIRAHMCEALGEEKGMDDTARLFTLGLLSTLDALFDQNMNKLLENIPLVDEMKEALIRQEGELGELLKNIIDYEHCNVESLESTQANLPLLTESYLWAVSETEEFHLFEDD